jgi:hypothetical protein
LEEDPSSPQYQAFLWLGSQNLFTPNGDLHTKYALVTLYFATDGENWSNQEGWLGDGDFCEWYSNSPATVCDSTGSDILLLELPSNDLRGTLPDELGLLTAMTSLSLPVNDLVGTLPSTLFSYSSEEEASSSSSSLRFLFLDGNTLTGTMPSEIGKMTMLQEIHLVNNRLSGYLPTEIGNLENLRVFSTEWCAFNGTIPSEIGRLTRLDEFGTSALVVFDLSF